VSAKNRIWPNELFGKWMVIGWTPERRAAQALAIRNGDRGIDKPTREPLKAKSEPPAMRGGAAGEQHFES
jgi:hypothetical protein